MKTVIGKSKICNDKLSLISLHINKEEITDKKL